MKRRQYADTLSEKLRHGGITIWIAIVSSLVTICWAVIFLRDFLSNWYGWNESQTFVNVIQGTGWQSVVNIAIALMIQLASTMLMYSALLMKPTTRAEQYGIVFIIIGALTFLFIDVFYGYQYYILPESRHINILIPANWETISEVDLINIRAALMNSLFVDTVLSEVLGSIALSTLFSVYPDMRRYMERNSFFDGVSSRLPDYNRGDLRHESTEKRSNGSGNRDHPMKKSKNNRSKR